MVELLDADSNRSELRSNGYCAEGVVGQGVHLLHQQVSASVIGSFFDVYNELGYGFLECVYKRALLVALQQAGLCCQTEVQIPVMFRGVNVGDYRADLIVANRIIVETKTAARIQPVHEVQLFNYLKASRIRVGLILNFGPQATFQRHVLTASLKLPAVSR